MSITNIRSQLLRVSSTISVDLGRDASSGHRLAITMSRRHACTCGQRSTPLSVSWRHQHTNCNGLPTLPSTHLQYKPAPFGSRVTLIHKTLFVYHHIPLIDHYFLNVFCFFALSRAYTRKSSRYFSKSNRLFLTVLKNSVIPSNQIVDRLIRRVQAINESVRFQLALFDSSSSSTEERQSCPCTHNPQPIDVESCNCELRLRRLS